MYVLLAYTFLTRRVCIMSYEVFSRKTPRIVSPAITIHPTGRIYLNQGASAQLVKDAAKRVLLLWDRENLKLAIKPLSKKDNRAYSIAYSHKGSGSTITARGFLAWIGYSTEPGTVTLDAVWNEKEGIFEVKIPPEKITGEMQPHGSSSEKPLGTKKLAAK
jgi:hypothetical protein